MSDATQHHDEDGPHEGPIKTPKQLIVAVVFAFLVPIVAITLLVKYVTAGHRPAAGSDALSMQAVAERISPVGMVEVKDTSNPAALKTGEQVYASVCVTCHGSGALGAPKFGDAAAWGPRISQGYETLLTHALKGYKAMPPQGGGDNTELEIGRAVVYMANKGGAHFEEPKAPAQAANGKPAASEPAPAAPAQANVAAAATTAPAAPPEKADAKTAAPVAAAAATQGPPTLYTQVCSACHGTGVLNAPKLGDKAAWAPRIAQGVDALVNNAMHGKGAMPPKGGSSATEAQIKEVVQYMVSQAK